MGEHVAACSVVAKVLRQLISSSPLLSTCHAFKRLSTSMSSSRTAAARRHWL